uniref:Uncharacterized protein n=1 Tax=Parascaris equorum TaxID=6256 RepID=A0A914S5L8_PAREQ
MLIGNCILRGTERVLFHLILPANRAIEGANSQTLFGRALHRTTLQEFTNEQLRSCRRTNTL